MINKNFESSSQLFESLRNDICEEIKTNGKEIYPDIFFDLFILGTVYDRVCLDNWNMNSVISFNIKCVHITHNDADAIGCGLLTSLITHLHTNSKNLKTYYCDTNAASKCITDNVLSDIDPKDMVILLISDININDEVTNIIENSKNIFALNVDHHPTNDHDKYYWGFVDRSGKFSGTAVLFKLLKDRFNLMYKNMNKDSLIEKGFFNKNISDYFTPDCSFHPSNIFKNNVNFNHLMKIINDISRYDTWEWKNSPSILNDEDETSIALKIVDRDCRYLVSVMTENLFSGKEALETDGIKYLIHKRKKAEPKIIDSALKYVKCIDIDVPGICKHENIPVTLYDGDYGNAIMEAMYTKYPEADFVCTLYPKVRKIGFRTKNPNINVGVIAKSLCENNQGGGHATAAGCTVPASIMIDLLNKVYNAEDNCEV